MKKTDRISKKKLVLGTETLRRLNTKQLEQVNGGRMDDDTVETEQSFCAHCR